MQLFYASQIDGNRAVLTEEESRHLKVLRKTPEEILHITDGKGYLYEARISETNIKSSRETVADIISSTLQPRNRNYHLHLMIAPTKQNERMEWLLEKAIETGLDKISFLQTDNSEKTRINMGRLEKIAISAMKQSGEYYMPEIVEIRALKDVLETTDGKGLLMAHCYSEYPRFTLREQLLKNTENNICIMIGPEGDFSKKEVDTAQKKGIPGISLGNTRLRTETAGLYACMACSILLK